MIRFRLSQSDLRKIERVFSDLGILLEDNLDGAMDELARGAHGVIMNAIKTARPLSGFTIEKKGHDLIFLENGEYLRALRIYRRIGEKGKKEILVGIPAGAVNRRGYSLVKLGAQLERGFVSRVTEKMRQYFLRVHGLKISPEKEAMVIPPRPHINPGILYVRGNAKKVVSKFLRRTVKRLRR